MARKSSNGKSQYIESATNISLYQRLQGLRLMTQLEMQLIVFVANSGASWGWLASQADMLEEDWCIVE